MRGFDDIINNLDGRLKKFDELLADPDVDPVPEAPKLEKPLPPTFKVGDVVVIRETRWPPKDGKVNERTGLYSDPGFPNIHDLERVSKEQRYPQQADEIDQFQWHYNYDLRDALNEKLVGTVKIGDICKIVAVWCHEDGKSYYFLDNGRSQGWTRCSFRFRHATADERRKR